MCPVPPKKLLCVTRHVSELKFPFSVVSTRAAYVCTYVCVFLKKVNVVVLMLNELQMELRVAECTAGTVAQ